MIHSNRERGSFSRRYGIVKRAVRRTINLRILSLTLAIVSAVGIGLYFWRLYQVSQAADSLLARAEALEKEGKIGSAVDYLRRYLQFRPQDDEAFVHLAETMDTAQSASLQRKNEVVSLYLGALKLKDVPQNKKAEMCERAGELLVELEAYESAREQAEKLLGIKELPPEEELTVDKNNPRAIRLMALSLYHLHEQDKLQAAEKKRSRKYASPRLATQSGRHAVGSGVGTSLS